MAIDYGRAATLTLGDGMIQTPCLNHATTQYLAAAVAHLIKHATRTRRDKLKLPMSTRLYASKATVLDQLVKSSCLDAVLLLCGHRADPLSACCCEHKITSRLWMNLAVHISREDIWASSKFGRVCRCRCRSASTNGCENPKIGHGRRFY